MAGPEAQLEQLKVYLPTFAPVITYLNGVEATGLVSGVVIGSREGERTAHLWNILTEDFSPTRTIPSLQARLNHLIYGLDRSLSMVMPTRISNVSPSRLKELLRTCQAEGIETTTIPFTDSQDIP